MRANAGFIPDNADFAWLADRQAGWQFGEQGVLCAIVERLGLTGQCVEIGAGNGESLPLTIDPFYRMGMECLLFEADHDSQAMLRNKYALATVNGEFSKNSWRCIDEQAVVCVIDVDGTDSVFAAHTLNNGRYPSVLMVEHFDFFAPCETYGNLNLPVWACGLRLASGFTLQDTADTLIRLAAHHGYVRVGTTRVNSIFVHNRHLKKMLDKS